MGKGGTCSHPWKCCKVLFALQMLSKISVDEVFMHYFDKMLSASGASPLDRTPTGDLPLDPGDFRPSEPLIAHPWKKIL